MPVTAKSRRLLNFGLTHPAGGICALALLVLSSPKAQTPMLLTWALGCWLIKLAAEGSKLANGISTLSWEGLDVLNRSTSVTAAQYLASKEGTPGEPPAPYSIGGSVYKTASEIKVASAGVDTLYQSYRIDPDVLASWRTRFEEWKLAAQDANERQRLPFADGLLFMLPKGRGHYAYVIEQPGLGELFVSYNKLFATHPVRVRLSALFNASAASFDELEQAALALVERVFGPGCTPVAQVSELHVAVDFTGYAPTVADLVAGRLVCPAALHVEEANWLQGDIHSMRWGKHGSPISAALYNKHKEIREQSPHKAFLLEKWAAGGWSDADGEVYRLEFRFSREWLRERGIDAPGDVDLASLLASGMSWLELRDPSANDTNRARWAVSPIWLDLQAQAAKLLAGVWTVYKADYVPSVTINQLAAQVGGCVACVGALVGHDNLEDIFAFVRSLFEQKLERTGENFLDLVKLRRDRYMLPAAD